ncbi:MAG: prolyl oligopeptidase family serine peptidase [Gemmatimonadetes bacterium]|nr:prolyl oligopeptidase family serine peptidase [Gemmatimonadota bacterium]
MLPHSARPAAPSALPPLPSRWTLRASAALLLTLPAVAVAQNRPGNAAAPAPAAPAKADKPDILADEGYVTPPPAIAKLVTAARETNRTLAAPSPGARKWFMRTVSDGLPALKQVGKVHHNLGGFQVDPRGNRDRGMTMRSAAGLEVTEWETGKRISVQVPAGARVSTPVWSPDGTQIAFLALFDDATQLYVADPATGASRPVSRTSLLATMVTAPAWTADGKSLVTVLVPDGRAAEPREPALATGPQVRVNENNKLKTRTYPDLLQTPYEKDLLVYHTTGQLALLDVKTRAVKKVGAPGVIRALDASPDGQHFRVTYLEQPFSYVLPVSSFGTREVIIDGTGTVLRELAKRPLREGEDPGDPGDPRPATAPGAGRGGNAAADTGKRNLQWHPFAGGLLYAQIAPAPAAPAGGRGAARPDSASVARRPDRLMHWKAPFDSTSASVLYETTNRIASARFNDAGTILFVSETGTGGSIENAIFLTENNAKFTISQPRRGGRGDSASAPTPPAGGPPAGAFGGRGGAGGGALVTRPGSKGVPVVMVSTDGKYVFQQGTTPDSARSPRVYVERIEIRTGTRTRLYESDGTVLETISAPLDDDFTRAVIQRESPTLVPQSYALTLASKEAKQLTQNVDLMPEISKAQKRTVVARRADGYSFNVKVTLPADYQNGTRLPAMFWFYPREYDNQQAYDRSLQQGAAAERRYPTFGPRSLQFLVTQGYAVVEPDAPIFASDGQLPNDNYVADLRNNLAAIIDALDTLQIIDRHRLGLGGHSYGAFSTVNAMVHTPYFKAGIAGDGAYNRTLTPNGFQSERRDLWQGRETYLSMSPMLYADQLNGALLMYHSTEDQNVGTDPINSVRMYHALMGLGKTTSLYMYPYEDHGPIAKETVLDQWGRWVAWLDKYVKNANQKKVTTMQ